MSESKLLDQLSEKDLYLLQEIRTDFKNETGKDFFLEIDSLEFIINHYQVIFNNIPKPETTLIPQRKQYNFATDWDVTRNRIAMKKVYKSDLDKSNKNKREKINLKFGFAKWLKKQLENELLKRSLIPYSDSVTDINNNQKDSILDQLSEDTKKLIEMVNGKKVWKSIIKIFCQEVINPTWNNNIEFSLHCKNLYKEFEFAKYPDYTFDLLLQNAKKHKELIRKN